jgi:hypothetical protein
MKNHLVRFSMLVLGAAAAWAQNPYPLKANVPFDFNASGVSMPAGHYIVSANPVSGFITLKGDAGKNATIQTIAAETAATPVTARLVFRRYGDQYFLAETWTTGSNIGRQITPTKQERLLAGRATPARTVVAASK